MFDRIKQGVYWDRLLRLVDGCTPCSPGCQCWVAREAKVRTFGAKDLLGPNGMWNGNIRLCHDNLDLPLRTKKPQAWLILNDLFHEDVPWDFILDTLNIIHASPRHIFLILTKRIKRASFDISKSNLPENLWFGVTACNQQEADEKIPILLQIPAAVRWLSIEPMLGPIKLDWKWLAEFIEPYTQEAIETASRSICYVKQLKSKIHLVVLGGESGPGARPMRIEWARSVRDQCQSSGVPFFFKQWGEWVSYVDENLDIKAKHYHKFPDGQKMRWVGKKAAGRLLDGRTWNELPKVSDAQSKFAGCIWAQEWPEDLRIRELPSIHN